ncbi:MAG: CAP domain-containing protein [Paracoccaceae bacterium]
MKPALSAAVLFLASLVGCGATPVPPSATTTKNVITFEAGNFETLLTTARSGRGLANLAISAQLTQIAQGHADEMSGRKIFSHTDSDGNRVDRRARAQSYAFCWIAENIAFGRMSESEAFARWMASAGHRKNMLARGASQYGLAAAPGNYRVLVLGRPGC